MLVPYKRLFIVSAVALAWVNIACVTTADAAPAPVFAPQIINSNFNKQTWGRDVNNLGVVVGYFEGPSQSRAFAWTPTKGFSTLKPGTTDATSQAFAINDCGQIVGWGGIASNPYGHSALWNEQGTLKYLPELGGPGSDAVDINEKGHVVGASLLPPTSFKDPDYHAFYWSKTAGIIDLGTLGGPNSSAEAINNNDEVVGYSDVASGAVHAFYWSFGTGMVDLGPELTALHGYDINDPGRAVGAATVAPQRGFSWNAAAGVVLMSNVGAQSTAYGINKLAQIVGEGRDSTNARRATIWQSAGGTGKIFDTSTGHASIARKINDNGTVVGDATVTVNFVSSNRAVVWVPQPVVSHPPPPEAAYCTPL